MKIRFKYHLIDFGKHGPRLKGLREYFDQSLHHQFLLGKIGRFRLPSKRVIALGLRRFDPVGQN
jgi:hypothetical protein